MKRYLLLVLLLPIPSLASAQTRMVAAPPVLDTAAYATGDVMSATAMTFTRALKNSSKSGIVVSAAISDAAAQAFDLELWLFSEKPTASSFGADNAAFDPTDAQLLTVVGIIKFTASTSYFAANDNGVHTVNSIAQIVRTSNGDGDLYGVLVARGAYDGAAANDLTVTLGIDQD